MAEKSNTNIGERFAVLEIATERPQTSHPKIRRVPNYIRNRKDFAEYFIPKLVSMGPIHHGDPNLKLGEQHKLMWAAKYIERTAQTPQVLYKRITDNIEELKGLFTADLFTDNKFSNYRSEGFANLEEKLSWILFVDGCALLQILEKAPVDEHQLNVNFDIFSRVLLDLILLENQLPYLVLKLLWRDNNEYELIDTMKSFFMYPPGDEFRDESPPHLFHLFRRIVLSREFPPNEANEEENADSKLSRAKEEYNKQNDYINLVKSMVGHRFRTIEELREAGIIMKSSKAPREREISFKHGWFAAELRLPEIIVHHRSIAHFLNLTAYEMCPDFENNYEICSFVGFMASLIDNPDDVKTLRSEGILCCSLVSDEEVAKLYNIISTDLMPNPVKYANLRAQIDMHYKNKCKIWIAQGRRTYLKSPWTFIAFVAAFLALVLTLIQTWFAIDPKS